MSPDQPRYASLLSRLVNESDTALVLRHLVVHDAVRTALEVAAAEEADMARTVADHVLALWDDMSHEVDIDQIEHDANDADAVRAGIRAYREDL